MYLYICCLKTNTNIQKNNLQLTNFLIFFCRADDKKKKEGTQSPLFLIPFKDDYLVTVIFTVLIPSVVVTFTK